jgi:putative intracellular protease/amidase
MVEGDTSTGIVLIVLPPEFEYPEYEGIRFNLERLGCRVVVASITSEQPVGFDEVHRFEPAQPPPGEQPEVMVDLMLEDARVGDYDAIVFISDPSWFTGETERAVDFAREAADAGLVVGGLSNVVSVLGRAGLLEGVRATGFSCEQMAAVHGAICTWSTVERDGRIVTGDVSFPCARFAQTIVEALQEEDT